MKSRFLIVLLTAFLVGMLPARADSPTVKNGVLFYATLADMDTQDYDLMLVQPDGSNARKVGTLRYNFHARWSPDGRSLLFISQPKSDSSSAPDLYLLNGDGTNIRNLTNQEGASFWGDWSPDGKSIAFMSTRTGNLRIWRMDADGKNPKILTPDFDAAEPVFSPDGKQIAFFKMKLETLVKRCLSVMELSTGEIRTLDDCGDDARLNWAPDGKTLAFVRNVDNRNDLMVADFKSLTLKTLLSAPGLTFYNPMWSTDGSRLLFCSTEGVETIGADGSNRQLLRKISGVIYPTWSPDGTQVAFGASDDGKSAIYVMNADGSNLKRVTDYADQILWPVWQPIIESKK